MRFEKSFDSTITDLFGAVDFVAFEANPSAIADLDDFEPTIDSARVEYTNLTSRTDAALSNVSIIRSFWFSFKLLALKSLFENKSLAFSKFTSLILDLRNLIVA